MIRERPPAQRYTLDPVYPLTSVQFNAMQDMVRSLNSNYKVKHEAEDRAFNFVVQEYHIPIIQRLFSGWKWQTIIKGRQVYITTLVTLMMMDLCSRRPGFTCLVRNMTDPDSSKTIAEKFNYVIEKSPWLQPQIVNGCAYKEKVDFKNGSNIVVGKSGRSSTPNFTLLTEASILAEKDPRAYREAYVGSTNGGQHYMIFQETSPYGYNNQFIQQVRECRELEQQGRLTKGDFVNYFAAWWRKWNNRVWDPETIERTLPIPPEKEEYFAHIESIEPVRLDMNQKVFYIITERSKCRNNPLIMRQEHPSTLDEALQTFSEAYVLREAMDVAESKGRIKDFRVSSSAPCAVFWDFGAGRAHTAYAIMQLDHWGHPNHYKWVGSFSEGGATPLPVWFARVNSENLNIAHHFLPHDAGYENMVAKKLVPEGGTIADAFDRAGIRNVSILPKVKEKRAGFEAANRFAYDCIFCKREAARFIEALYGATRKYDEKTETALSQLDPANVHSHLYDCFELAARAHDGNHLGMLEWRQQGLPTRERTGPMFDGAYV